MKRRMCNNPVIRIISLLFLVHFVVVEANDPDVHLSDRYKYSVNEVQKLIDELDPGDTLNLPAGVLYLDKPIRIRINGTQENPIVISGSENGRTVFNSFHLTKDPESGKTPKRSKLGSVHINNASHVKIKNIVVEKSRNIGILALDKTTQNIEIINCESHGSYNSGIALWYSDRCKVMGCVITGANDQELRVTEPLRREGPHEALTIAGATNFEIAYNEIFNCEKEGIDCKEVSSHGIIYENYVHDMPRQGIYVDCWFGLLEDVAVYNNIVDRCEWGIVISAEGEEASMDNIRIYNNILTNNKGSGFFFGVWGHDELRTNIYIFNNTLLYNGTMDHWAGVTGGIDLRSHNLEDVYIFNNLVACNTGFEIATFDQGKNEYSTLKEKNIQITNNYLNGDFDPVELEGLYGTVWPYQNDPSVYDIELIDCEQIKLHYSSLPQLKNKGISINGYGYDCIGVCPKGCQ